MGQSPSSTNYTNNPKDNILVQGNADMKNGYVVPRVWTTQITKQAKKGDLILSVRAPVGDIGKTDYDVVIGRGVAAVKGNKYIFQLLTKMKITGYWIKFSTGSTFESINSDNIKNAQIIIAGDSEQNKIGKFFNKLDTLTTLKQEQLSLYEKLKKGLLQKLSYSDEEYSPAIRFTDFDDDWEQWELDNIFQILDGDRGKNYPGENDFSSSGSTLFLDTGNVTKNGFNFSKRKYITSEKDNVLKNGKLKLHDFVLTSRGTLGNFAYYNEQIESSYPSLRINSAMLILRPKIRNLISDNYLLYVLNSKVINNFLREKHVGSAQPHITKKAFSKIKVEIPKSVNEQNKIGKSLLLMNNLINSQQFKLNELRLLKKYYLQKLFV